MRSVEYFISPPIAVTYFPPPYAKAPKVIVFIVDHVVPSLETKTLEIQGTINWPFKNTTPEATASGKVPNVHSMPSEE